MSRPSLRAALAGLAALAGVVAAAPAFGRGALTDARFLLPAAGAVVLVTALGVALPRLRPPARLGLELAALALFVLPLTRTGLSIVDGPKRMVTAALPLDRAGAELAALALGLGLAAVAAVELALRRANPAWPLAPVLLAVAAGCAVAAPAGVPPWWLAPALVAAAAAQLLLGAAVPRRAAAGLLALALVTLAGLTGASMVPRAPLAARDLVPQPVVPRQTVSPLAMFPALRTGRLPLELTVTAAEHPERLRYATLTHFDGTYWRAEATYRRAGGTLPPGPDAAASRLVEDRVHVVTPGPLGWLVSEGRPVTVSISGLGIDEDTGDVLIPNDRPVPSDYTVRSAVAGYAAAELDDAGPARPRGGEPLVPPDLAAEAARLAGGEYGYPALTRLADWFARDGGFGLAGGASAPAGHGTFQIRTLLRTRTGTAEQYASAFAVLARALGYESRVTVGFRTRPGPGGALQVSGRDVDAWPEIRFTGFGWVAFAPTPQSGATPAAPPRPAATPPAAASPAASPRADGAAPEAAGPRPESSAPGAGAPVAVAALSGLTLLLLLLGAGPAYRRVRRHRRMRGDPRARTAGAWRQALDDLRAAGLTVPRAASSGWIAAEVARRFDGPAGAEAAGLAALHDRIAYARGDATAADADRAWRHAGALRRAVHARLSVAARLRAAVWPPAGRRGRVGSPSDSRARPAVHTLVR